MRSLDRMMRSVGAAILAIGMVGASTGAWAQAEQGRIDCGLAVYLDDGSIIDLVVGEGHVVLNKNNAHLVCHASSQTAADLLQHAEHYRSECIIPGDGETFELTELNVSTPSGRVTFVCHLP